MPEWAHFCEGALSGYAGTDFESFDGFDWEHLADATAQVAEQGRQLGLWVVLGSAHRLLNLTDRTTACTTWRDRAIHGTLHSGTLVDDPRSPDRTRYWRP